MGFLIPWGCAEQRPEVYYSLRQKACSLVPLDTLTFSSSGSVFVSRTAQIASWHQYILISDFYEKKLWVFDTLLNFQIFLGGKGGGPGEFASFPTIATSADVLWLFDHSLLRATQYDRQFRLLQTKSLPSGFLFRRQVVFQGDRFVAAMHPARMLNSVDELRNESVLTVLDTNLQVVARLGQWDDKYFEQSLAARTYGYHNSDALLTASWEGGIFVLQKAVHWVSHFGNTLQLLKKFGIKPVHFKEPPSVPYEQTAYSPEMISNYAGSTTQFLSLDCDTTQRLVFVNYVNLDSTVFFQRTMLAGKHYLQIYNGEYDCVFDGPIPGKLAFVRSGRIYVLTHEEPEFLRLVVFALSE